ncbi:hypothetical protein V2J09_005122, partial [Rumex salicifolius]
VKFYLYETAAFEEEEYNNDDAEKLVFLLLGYNSFAASAAAVALAVDVPPPESSPLSSLPSATAFADPFNRTSAFAASASSAPPPPLLSCLISCSIAATSFIVGRSSGVGFTQSSATPMVCVISSISDSGLPCRVGSRISAAAPLLCRTQSTMWRPSGIVGSIGCFPPREPATVLDDRPKSPSLTSLARPKSAMSQSRLIPLAFSCRTLPKLPFGMVFTSAEKESRTAPFPLHLFFWASYLAAIVSGQSFFTAIISPLSSSAR